MKTMHSLKKLLILGFVCLFPALRGQEPPEQDFRAFHDALGMFGSTAAGKPIGGLHYQHWFDNFGFQMMAGGIYNPAAESGNTLDYSATVDGLWTVYGNGFSDFLSGRLYLWVSGGTHGYTPGKYSYDELSGEKIKNDSGFVSNALAGAGIGIETILFQHFSFPFQFGYTAEFPEKAALGFSVAGGLRYRY
jgi:hypothetical protein